MPCLFGKASKERESWSADVFLAVVTRIACVSFNRLLFSSCILTTITTIAVTNAYTLLKIQLFIICRKRERKKKERVRDRVIPTHLTIIETSVSLNCLCVSSLLAGVKSDGLLTSSVVILKCIDQGSKKKEL